MKDLGGIMAQTLFGAECRPGTGLRVVATAAEEAGAPGQPVRPASKERPGSARPASRRRLPALSRAGLIAGLLGTTAWFAMPAPAAAQERQQRQPGLHHTIRFVRHLGAFRDGQRHRWGLRSDRQPWRHRLGNQLGNRQSLLDLAEHRQHQQRSVGGILAQSAGGIGGGSGCCNAGSGADSGSASVTLNLGGSVSVVASGTPPTGSALAPSAGVTAAVVGGAGGDGPENVEGQSGGAGGSVQGDVQVSITDANVATTGNGLIGVLAFGQGGAGGNSGCQYGNGCNPDQSAGHDSGGNGGNVSNDATVAINAATQSITISTAGTSSPAIAAILLGGVGGNGGSQVSFSESDSGDGGNGGTVSGFVNINLNGTPQTPITLTTQGNNSSGVYALSLGGNGGFSGDAQATTGSAYAHQGGNAGSGADVAVNLTATSINTQPPHPPASSRFRKAGPAAQGARAPWGSEIAEVELAGVAETRAR